jgi:hypothetical protein
MIEKLLSRIARRNPQPDPLLVIAPGSHGNASPLSSASASDPFSTPYPAPRRVRSARYGLSEHDTGNAWTLACDAYASRRLAGGPIADQPAYFAHWGAAQMAVAQMLWAQREQLNRGEVHIRCGEVLLAVFAPAQRQVSLHAAAYQTNEPLALHQLPAEQRASESLGKNFENYPLYSLLWFYGQVYSDAPDLLPAEMGTQLIQLRRFPLVEPAALEMRHLALIHVFSGGALSFMQLQKQVAPSHANSLCADLASLYFTGALRLLP